MKSVQAAMGRGVAHARTWMFHATRPIVAWLFRLWIRGGRRIPVGPFEVVNRSTRTGVEGDLHKIEQAAELIREHDPARYRLLVREIRLIVVADWRTEAEYYSFASAVVVQARFLGITNLEGMAMILVHEATHARLHRWGIRYSAALKTRVERLCLRNEVWFLEKVPSGAALAALRRARLLP